MESVQVNPYLWLEAILRYHRPSLHTPTSLLLKKWVHFMLVDLIDLDISAADVGNACLIVLYRKLFGI